MIQYSLNPATFEDSLFTKIEISILPLVPCCLIILAFRRIFKYQQNFQVSKMQVALQVAIYVIFALSLSLFRFFPKVALICSLLDYLSLLMTQVTLFIIASLQLKHQSAMTWDESIVSEASEANSTSLIQDSESHDTPSVQTINIDFVNKARNSGNFQGGDFGIVQSIIT